MRSYQAIGLIWAIALLGAATPMIAQTVIDFDGVASGTVVDTQYQGQGVTFSCVGSCAGTSIVAVSTLNASPPNAVAPQGLTCFSEFQGLVRADFSTAVSQVTIETIADNGSDPAWLGAYDSTDTLIDSDQNTGNQGVGNSVTLSVSGAIAYVTFAGLLGDTACFDDLSFVAQQVPTMPGVVLLLLTLTLLGVGCWMLRPTA